MEFWDALAPIPLPVPWMGHVYNVAFHILTGKEETHVLNTVRGLLSEEEKDDNALKEKLDCVVRLCFAIMTVDTLPSPNPHDSTEEFEKKFNLLNNLPGSLIDVLIMAYEKARILPLTMLNEMNADPNIEAGRL